MKIFKNKPGVFMLPVLVISVIFFLLLLLLLNQKKFNNELILEYRASRVVSLLVDIYDENGFVEPKEIDEGIIGFGIYDTKGKAFFLFGTAPEKLYKLNGINEKVIVSNKSVVIIRFPPEQGMNPLADRFNDEHSKRKFPMSGARPTMRGKASYGIFIEYDNSGYSSELKLLVFMSIFFAGSFGAAFFLIFKLYSQNKKLIINAEHDKQLIQLGEAARTLAHEIRNPLSALKLQRDLLKKKLPQSYHSNLAIIDNELRRLNVLVERVGDFLKNPVGNRVQLDLNDFLRGLYNNRDDVIINFSSGEARILFDKDRLRTVIDNVVNNAVDSCGKAFVEVTAGPPCSVKITDTGQGFDSTELERFFDPFFTTKTNGTGLGLSIVKRLVEAVDGNIFIGNRKERGAFVIIEFEVVK